MSKKIDIERNLKESFLCPKCKSQEAITKKINLSGSNLKNFFPGGSNKYLFLTCTLCGYTEIYDLYAYVRKDVPQENKANLANEISD